MRFFSRFPPFHRVLTVFNLTSFYYLFTFRKYLVYHIFYRLCRLFWIIFCLFHFIYIFIYTYVENFFKYAFIISYIVCVFYRLLSTIKEFQLLVLAFFIVCWSVITLISWYVYSKTLPQTSATRIDIRNFHFPVNSADSCAPSTLWTLYVLQR